MENEHPEPQPAPQPQPEPAPQPPEPASHPPARVPASRPEVRVGPVSPSGTAQQHTGPAGGGGGGGQKRRRRRSSIAPGCIGAIVFASAGFVLIMFVMILALAAAGGPSTAIGSAGDLPAGADSFRERYVSGAGEDRVAIIPIHGVIMGGGGSTVLGAIADIVEATHLQLERAAADDSVKAIVLDVDSPGGGVTASDVIYRRILDFKTKSKKPVVAAMGSVAASGGYYVSAPADHIFCQPTTITGSIGVIMQPFPPFNMHKLLTEEWKLEPVTITSGPNKNLLDPLEEPKPEQRAILQSLVDDMYARFVEVVVEGRKDKGLPVDRISQIADGRIYSAEQAKELGLVDEIGYLDDAIAKARTLAKLPRATAFRYVREPTFADLFGLQATLGGGQAGAGRAPLRIEIDPAALAEMATPRLWYIWSPGLTPR